MNISVDGPGTGNPDSDQTNILFAVTGVRLRLLCTSIHLVFFGTSICLARSVHPPPRDRVL